MKLDKPDAPHSEPLVSEDWTLDVFAQGNQFVGKVSRHGQETCRVSLTAEGLTHDAARTALADKARAWIREYLSRTNT